jgi:hypothetical protein
MMFFVQKFFEPCCTIVLIIWPFKRLLHIRIIPEEPKWIRLEKILNKVLWGTDTNLRAAKKKWK